MGRARPERGKSMEAWIESGGKLTAKELAAQFGVSENMIRKWKSQDQWALKLKKPRGAPKGNRNAKGHGAPKGNKNSAGHGGPAGNRNAETHGAYAAPDTEKFTPEDWEKVRWAEQFGAALAELTKKKIDLTRRIAELEECSEEKFDTGGTDVYRNGKRAGCTVSWEGKFQRLEKLELQLHRVNNKILNILELMQKNEREKMRLEIERERIELAREKAMGIFGEDEGEN